MFFVVGRVFSPEIDLTLVLRRVSILGNAVPMESGKTAVRKTGGLA
jgi:hypothetical protein